MSTPLPVRVDPDSRIPLAAQLAEQLTWLIASGELAIDSNLPPARSLADQLGINFHTVRAGYQQLAADGLISLERGRPARVLAYDRSMLTRHTASGPSFTIGAILPMFVPFYAPLLDGLEAGASQHPAMLFICNARDDPRTAIGYLDRLIAKKVDGVVAAAPLLNSGLDGKIPNRPPIVFIDDPGAPGMNVGFDLENSQYLATSHLIEHGHSRIGYLTIPRDIRHIAPKYEGYLRALREAGIQPEEDLVATVPDFSLESGRAGASQLLAAQRPPTAIAAIGDELAIGAYQTISALGLRIPDDVAITGNDGSEVGAVLSPPLTTVSLPVRQAGLEAIAMLEEAIKGNQPEPSRVTLGVQLLIRESCGCSTTG